MIIQLVFQANRLLNHDNDHAQYPWQFSMVRCERCVCLVCASGLCGCVYVCENYIYELDAHTIELNFIYIWNNSLLNISINWIIVCVIESWATSKAGKKPNSYNMMVR